MTFNRCWFPHRPIRLATEGWLTLACFETTAHQWKTDQTRVADWGDCSPSTPTGMCRVVRLSVLHPHRGTHVQRHPPKGHRCEGENDTIC